MCEIASVEYGRPSYGAWSSGGMVDFEYVPVRILLNEVSTAKHWTMSLFDEFICSQVFASKKSFQFYENQRLELSALIVCDIWRYANTVLNLAMGYNDPYRLDSTQNLFM